ncbi:13839_t:CDS:2, partial [Entrophospora sp. SA101]
DWYPARSIFQILIAIASGPRFLLIYLFYIITNKSDSLYPKIHAIIGLIRTISCGGWVYITSTDDHDIHDVAMIVYLVTTLPWMVGSLLIGPQSNGEIKWRKIFSFSFFGSLVPMIYYFIEHKVNRVAGAYTTYAFLEWSLIIYDIAFDAITFLDFNFFELQIINANLQQEYEWGNYDLKFIVKGKEQLQNKTTLSQMQSSWPTQTVTASTTSDTVPPAKKWRLASPKNYDPNKRIIVGFSDAMFNVWMKRKTGRCM